MKSIKLLILIVVLGLFTGCGPAPCEDVACGPGDCIEGICVCPDGFSGEHCEIVSCFGVDCINGDCDPQTETCNCHPDYYGESCDILCVNGTFANGNCDCIDGFEGIACEAESRCRFIGWWGCSQWTITSQTGGPTTPGALPGTIKFEESFNVNSVDFFPTANSDGLMLLPSNKKIIGQVTRKTINFELQYLTNERTVHGTARLDDEILSMELFVFNPTTSLTEVAKGTFTLRRFIKQ